MLDYHRNLSLLKSDFDNGKRFTLFIGAGINASKSVRLLWKDIVGESCSYAFRRIGDNLNLRLSDTQNLLSILGIEPIDWNDNECIPNKGFISKEIFLNYLQLKEYIDTHFPVEIQVSIIKTLLGDAYIPFLQDYIYNQCNKEIIRKKFEVYRIDNQNEISEKELHTLYVVARMVLLNPQITNIVSYNYDNFLTYAICYLLNNSELFFTQCEIDFLKFRYRLEENESLEDVLPAVDVEQTNTTGKNINWRTIPIYHVHGYIPPKDELQYVDPPSIVLSMDEYCSSLRDETNWRIATQECFIQTSNSLFIGSSLTDLTTKRILGLSENNPNHNIYMLDAYSSVSSDEFNIDRAKQVFRQIRDSYLISLGVKVIDCDKGFEFLYTNIATIKDRKLQNMANEKA